MEISKIAVNGSTYDIKDTNTVTSINGKTGAIGASDIASVLTTAGYKLTDTDTNTVTSINGKTGAIAAADIAYVLTAAGYALTDTNTWRPLGTTEGTACAGNDSRLSDARPASDVYSWAKASSKPSYSWSEIGSRPTALSQFTNDSGYITGINKSMVTTALGYTPPTTDTNTVTSINGKTGDIAAADIATVLTSAGYKLTDADTNTWRPVQCNSTDIGSNTLNIVAGSNVSLSRSGGTITINSSYTDTNTWRPISDSVSSTSSDTSASSNAVKTAYDLAASKTSNTGTVTSVAAGTGLNGGTITTSGTLSVAYGTTAGTACQGNDSRLSDARRASDVYDWAKASTKPTYTAAEVITMRADAITYNTSSSCLITGASNSGKAQTIIYYNSGTDDVTVTVPTTYYTPDGEAIELTCPPGGYCEVSYLNIGNNIFARGL